MCTAKKFVFFLPLHPPESGSNERNYDFQYSRINSRMKVVKSSSNLYGNFFPNLIKVCLDSKKKVNPNQIGLKDLNGKI